MFEAILIDSLDEFSASALIRVFALDHCLFTTFHSSPNEYDQDSDSEVLCSPRHLPPQHAMATWVVPDAIAIEWRVSPVSPLLYIS